MVDSSLGQWRTSWKLLGWAGSGSPLSRETPTRLPDVRAAQIGSTLWSRCLCMLHKLISCHRSPNASICSNQTWSNSSRTRSGAPNLRQSAVACWTRFAGEADLRWTELFVGAASHKTRCSVWPALSDAAHPQAIANASRPVAASPGFWCLRKRIDEICFRKMVNKRCFRKLFRQVNVWLAGNRKHQRDDRWKADQVSSYLGNWTVPIAPDLAEAARRSLHLNSYLPWPDHGRRVQFNEDDWVEQDRLANRFTNWRWWNLFEDCSPGCAERWFGRFLKCAWLGFLKWLVCLQIFFWKKQRNGWPLHLCVWERQSQCYLLNSNKQKA